jgi:uncharacterized membrane protein (DUF4010 family)
VADRRDVPRVARRGRRRLAPPGGRRRGHAGAGQPTELKSALVFGALFALILLATAWAQDTFGGAGLYAIAAISGIHDMDAITLSTSRLAQDGGAAPGTAWRAIVIAAISNMIFKTALAGSFGGWRLLRRVALVFVPAAAVGVLAILMWPDWGASTPG